MNEAFRVVCPGVLQGALALFEDTLGAAVMDVAWGEHGDPGMSMLVVVPRKKVRQNATAAWISSKRPGKPGWYFSVLN